MTTDSKKVPALESVPYHLVAREISKTYQEKLAEALEGGKRKDKRKHAESRKICKSPFVCPFHSFQQLNAFRFYRIFFVSFKIKCDIKSQGIGLY